MKPIIIVAGFEKNEELIFTKSEIEKIIQEAYEGGLEDGKLQERAKLYTPYITQTREINPNDWKITCEKVAESFENADTLKPRSTVKCV